VVGGRIIVMKKLTLYALLILMVCNIGLNAQTYFKLASVYDYEDALEKAKTDKEISEKLQIYFIGLSDGMAWTDDLHKKEYKKRIYCLGDKTANILIIMAIVNNYIENKNFTVEEKQLYPIGLVVADAMKTEFPCN
tara:strand:+ start:187 stop:594 length:408 start_codon:yes stop_codon:yes gene_type:complete